MDAVKNIEKTFNDWHKKSPVHLPDGVNKWIAHNVWWITIVGIVISVIAAFNTLGALFWVERALTYLGAIAPRLSTGYVISGWIMIATMVAILVFQARAIQPLKSLKKSGWDLLFTAFLVGVAGSTLASVVQGEIFAAILNIVISGVIGGFLFFEIRSAFTASSSKNQKSEKKETA